MHERKTYAEKDGLYPHATLSKEGISGKTERYNRDFLVSTENKEYKITLKDDLCYNPANLKFGVICLNTFGSAIFSPIYVTFEIDKAYLPTFVGASLTQKDFIGYALRFQQGTVYERMAVSPEDLLSISRRFPSLAEQKKIASLVALVDARISSQRRLVELLKKHKRGLHSAIFGQKCRMVNADGKPWPAWRQVRIGDIFQERSERGGMADELLSVTINNGVKRQADTDKKDSSSENKSNYKKVLPGDIVYNTMRMWQGASGVSPWAGIVSPAYTVIYPRSRQNTIFWAYAFKYWRFIQEFQKFSQGLTSDTWNLKYSQLSDIRVNEPSIDEQEAIVNLLSMLDERVMAAEQELNKMRNLKSGLLQQLFV